MVAFAGCEMAFRSAAFVNEWLQVLPNLHLNLCLGWVVPANVHGLGFVGCFCNFFPVPVPLTVSWFTTWRWRRASLPKPLLLIGAVLSGANGCAGHPNWRINEDMPRPLLPALALTVQKWYPLR
jgi:hypothetical protein